MTLKKTIDVINGDMCVPYRIYTCNGCGEDIEEAWGYLEPKDNYHLCAECSFREGFIDGEAFMRNSGYAGKEYHVAVNPDGDIQWWGGKTTIPPWERPSAERRSSVRYRGWRNSVYERDDYTCGDCGQIGGDLNAHHIKSFKKYKKLRFDIDNGATLCIKCHKKITFGGVKYGTTTTSGS